MKFLQKLVHWILSEVTHWIFSKIFWWMAVNVSMALIASYFQIWFGFLILGISIFMLLYLRKNKLYSHRIAGNYTMKRIPFMDCIQCIEQYLTKNNKDIRVLGEPDGLDVEFFARASPYSHNTKKIFLHVLEACKNGKITLFGQQGVLTDINIDPLYIDKEKIIFTEGLPELHNGFNKIIYNNLTIEKNEAMEWAMKELLPSITRPS